jgi:hypothetical protein
MTHRNVVSRVIVFISAVLLTASRVHAENNAFPYCSWWLKTTPETMNVAYPDTEATYWTTPFIAKPGLQLKITGQYPQARYFSLTVYDNTFGYFTTDEGVTSGIADYLITPDSGSENPWQTSGAATGGTFTVTVKRDVTQVNKPKVWETLIMHNMLPNTSFTNAIQQIDPNDYGDPAAAESVMGPYYPLVASCDRSVFEEGGVDACFAAYQGQ